MNRLLILTAIISLVSSTARAQDDDMYFTPRKKSAQEKAQDAERKAIIEKYRRDHTIGSTFYVGTNRSSDEYNRRGKYRNTFSISGTDSVGNDIIDFKPGTGIYPDSTHLYANDSLLLERSYSKKQHLADTSYEDDYYYSRRFNRFDYAWTPYRYYDPFFYDPVYDPWYWYGPGWYGPWYYHWGGWGYYPVYRPVIVISGRTRFRDYTVAGRTGGRTGHGGYGGISTNGRTRSSSNVSIARRNGDAITSRTNSYRSGNRSSYNGQQGFNNSSQHNYGNYNGSRSSFGQGSISHGGGNIGRGGGGSRSMGRR